MLSSEALPLTLYFSSLLVLCFYGVHRYIITRDYQRHLRRLEESSHHTTCHPRSEVTLGEAPRVLIQLPLFNERFVVERLIEAVSRIEHPRGALLIQVLDDSTDDSAEYTRATAQAYADRGAPIEYLHRTERVGFKAGALAHGMSARPQFDYIVIFDADFIPESDFLKRTLPLFETPDIGMVQARWSHLNRERSSLTHAQAISLDSHFMVEHVARSATGCFFNFNGTAGVWRRECIEDAGGWSHDTITEDLDLSYRAQLKGWRFVFCGDLSVPSELPIEINAFKTQQHRWSKGSIQVARKLLPRVLKSDLPFKVKYEAFCHLTSNLTYVMMLILSAVHPIVLRLRSHTSWGEVIALDLPILLSATLSVCFFFAQGQLAVDPERGRSRLIYIPTLLALGIGLTLNNAKAVIEALSGRESPFVRTPKVLSVKNKSVSSEAIKSSLKRSSRGVMPYIELIFALYYLTAVYYCIQHQLWFALPFTALFGWGFLYVALLSLFQARFLRREMREAKLDHSV